MAVQKRRVTTATTPGHIPPPDEIPASETFTTPDIKEPTRRFRFAPIPVIRDA
jgi:hypothetical protein